MSEEGDAVNEFADSDSTDLIDLIFRIKVGKLELGDVFAYQDAKQTYIGIKGLLGILDFPINVNLDARNAEGWYIRESNAFFMKPTGKDGQSLLVSASGKQKEFKANDYLVGSDDLYLNQDALFKLLDMKHSLDLKDLVLKLEPSEPLPIQLKLARQKKKAATKRNYNATLPEKYIPYRAAGIPFVDVQTQYSSFSSGYSKKTYSALGAGDMAYMSSNYYLSGDDEQLARHMRITLFKDSAKNNLLGDLKASHFSFGDINPGQTSRIGSVGQEIGFRVTNKANGNTINQNTTDFVGDAQPGWDVELYRNDVFLGLQTIGENGRYEFFSQDVLYGDNIFKLVFHGPQGQRQEKTQVITLGRGGAMDGQVLYDLSFSKQNSKLIQLEDRPTEGSRRNRVNLNLSRSFGRYMSLDMTFSSYSFYDDERHNFVSPTAKLYLFNSVFSANVVKDIKYGQSTNFSFTRGLWGHSFLLNRIVNSSD
ncbi:MAG: hypothetical protein R3240_09225, partial [Gammaproteobacteria bacterium]|nr:hypothetical protein [Gammaproteobacteria bacterium]